MDAWPDAYRLLMTATPARLDGKGLGRHANVLVEGPPISELTEGGWLAPMMLFAPPPAINLKELKRSRDEFNMKAADALVDGPVIADAIANWKARAAHMSTIHYAVSIRHSKEFAEQLRADGFTCEHIDGTMNGGMREEILRRFKSGLTQVLTNVSLITEGFDAPGCRCVLVSRPTMSHTLWRQMLGRAMRPNEDGGYSYAIDCAGNLKRLGPPDDHVEWSLEDGVTVERAAAERPPWRECSECHLLFPAAKSACPFCGFSPETKTVSEVDIEVVEWGTTGTPKPLSPEARDRALNKLLAESGGDPARLESIAREYGLSARRLQQFKMLFAPIWRTMKS